MSYSYIYLFLDSPYRTPINRAILKLGEKGILQILKKKWWEEKGGGMCQKDESEKAASTSELGLANVGGVFLVLMCGCAASFVIAICEFLWNTRKVAVTQKVKSSLIRFNNLFLYFSYYLDMVITRLISNMP